MHAAVPCWYDLRPLTSTVSCTVRCHALTCFASGYAGPGSKSREEPASPGEKVLSPPGTTISPGLRQGHRPTTKRELTAQASTNRAAGSCLACRPAAGTEYECRSYPAAAKGRPAASRSAAAQGTVAQGSPASLPPRIMGHAGRGGVAFLCRAASCTPPLPPPPRLRHLLVAALLHVVLCAPGSTHAGLYTQLA